MLALALLLPLIDLPMPSLDRFASYLMVVVALLIGLVWWRARRG